MSCAGFGARPGSVDNGEAIESRSTLRGKRMPLFPIRVKTRVASELPLVHPQQTPLVMDQADGVPGIGRGFGRCRWLALHPAVAVAGIEEEARLQAVLPRV